MVCFRTESNADEACLPYCCLSIPSSSDLAFDVVAYTFILLNDAFTAASNVYTKKNIGPEVLLSVRVTQWDEFSVRFWKSQNFKLILETKCETTVLLPHKAATLPDRKREGCWTVCVSSEVGTRCLSTHIHSIFLTHYTAQPALRKNIFNLTVALQRLIKCGLGFVNVHL